MENRPNFTKKMSRTDILRELMSIHALVATAYEEFDRPHTVPKDKLRLVSNRLSELCKLI
jgi:hypothetical protein